MKVPGRQHPEVQHPDGRVYAVWFSRPKVLKIGHTRQASTYSITYNASARMQGRRGSLIWITDGTAAEEAFMQAYFQLRGYKAHGRKQRSCRVSEWLHCPDDTAATLKVKLNGLYEYMTRIKNDGF